MFGDTWPPLSSSWTLQGCHCIFGMFLWLTAISAHDYFLVTFYSCNSASTSSVEFLVPKKDDTSLKLLSYSFFFYKSSFLFWLWCCSELSSNELGLPLWCWKTFSTIPRWLIPGKQQTLGLVFSSLSPALKTLLLNYVLADKTQLPVLVQ